MKKMALFEPNTNTLERKKGEVGGKEGTHTIAGHLTPPPLLLRGNN